MQDWERIDTKYREILETVAAVMIVLVGVGMTVVMIVQLNYWLG